MATVIELPLDTYKGPVSPDWCPGCGDYGVLRSVQEAAGRLGIQPKDLDDRFWHCLLFQFAWFYSCLWCAQSPWPVHTSSYRGSLWQILI